MNTVQQLGRSPLFNNVSENTLQNAAQNGRFIQVAKNQPLCIEKNCLGVLLSGRAQVLGLAKEKKPVLNTLHSGDFFGAASLFGNTCTITEIIATEACEAVLLDEKTVEQLLQNDYALTRNYIGFLTEKICLLNQKIAAFTAGSAEKKLARYLVSQCKGGAQNQTVILPVSLAKLSTMLDLGRASLYRAFDCLEQNGYLTHQSNRVNIRSVSDLAKSFGGL